MSSRSVGNCRSPVHQGELITRRELEMVALTCGHQLQGINAHPEEYPKYEMSVPASASRPDLKKDADYVFYELTRSMCPKCRRIIDAQILLRDNKVYMRKRCPEHG